MGDIMEEKNKTGYYKIPKAVFWITIVIVIILWISMYLKIIHLQDDVNNAEPEKETAATIHMEYGNIKSRLKNKEECYLCGNANRSLMGYYRKFDTVGVIALNEWYVLDLRLKEYDETGNPIENSSGTFSLFGNTSGIDYHLNATPSRGMASAIISSTNGMFDKKEVQNNLCQECLDKVTGTLEGNFEMGKEEYLPFCLVDFATLEVYPLQKTNMAYTVRDYWVELEHRESEIEINVYYLPER